MKELIDKLTTNASITEAQANIVLQTVKDFVKEKFPIMAGAVDKLFNENDTKPDDDFL